VSDFQWHASGERLETVLPRCPDGGGDGPFPCWWVKAEPVKCWPETAGLVLHIERIDVPSGLTTVVRCPSRCAPP
jgi:hypothetical protein